MVCLIVARSCYDYSELLLLAEEIRHMLPGFEVCREYRLDRSNVFEGKALAEALNKNIRLHADAIKECLEYYTADRILKEHEKYPYPARKAIKHLEFINEMLE